MSETAVEIPGYVAGTWTIDPVHSEVSFVVRHMTWSTRRPPALRAQAAISSASGRPAWAASRPGCHGGSVQF